jgi:hypothetical protein
MSIQHDPEQFSIETANDWLEFERETRCTL